MKGLPSDKVELNQPEIVEGVLVLCLDVDQAGLEL